MTMTGEMTPTAYLAALKDAGDAEGFQKLVLGTVYDDVDALEETYEELIEEAEEAGDDEEFGEAAESFRKVTVLAWARDDNRMVENFAIQALYYGTLNDFDSLLENYTTVWALWAHILPKLSPRDRARLQDFARFTRSFQLGLRKVEEDDQRVAAAVSLLVPTFDKLGALNVKKIDDRRADIDDDLEALWDEVRQLLAQIEESSD